MSRKKAPTVSEILARRVQELMTDRRLNRSEMAKRLSLTQPMVSQFLNGKRGISLDVIDRLPLVLGVAPHELFIDESLSYESMGLSDSDQALLLAYGRADERTKRAVSALLELPGATPTKSTAVSESDADPVKRIADALIKAAGQLTGDRDDDGMARAGADRRNQPGARHRGPATRGS